jgi:biopolymer transport protein ExbD
MNIRRGRRIPPLVPVASMGDVAFLLIIFFMVTTNFIKEAHVKIDQASSPDIARVEESLVSVSLDKDGNLWLQGQPCPVQVLQEGVEALLIDRQDKTVMLKIDKDVRHERLGPVFMALSKAGAEIALIGTQEKE